VGVGTRAANLLGFIASPRELIQSETRLVVNAIYCQVMDIFSGQVPDIANSELDSKLNNGEISVREFVRDLASSDYRRRFYTPYPNTKVIEFFLTHPWTCQLLKEKFGSITSCWLTAD